MAKQIVRLQDVLGEHQDAVMAAAALQRMARSSAARTDGRLAFALGMLYCRQGQAAQNARAELPGAWREVSRRPHRAWLE
jgi:CHAD domain-containing protein